MEAKFKEALAAMTPEAHYIYIEEASHGYAVIDLDEACDDLTNTNAVAEPLYTVAQALAAYEASRAQLPASAPADVNAELLAAAIEWWGGYRPLAVSKEEHLKNPCVNLPTQNGKRLAEVIVAIQRAEASKEHDSSVPVKCSDGGAIYRGTCPDGMRCLHGCHRSDACYHQPTTDPAKSAEHARVCEWHSECDDHNGEVWHSACGEAWSLIEGGPAENGVNFCQGCGKPVHIIEKEQP